MKKFFTKTVVIALPLLFVWISMEVILKQIPNDYRYKASYLNKNAENIEVIVLGSSHSFYGVNPIFFERNAFNMAHVSQSLDYDFMLFDKYKYKFKNLKAVYISISYFSLWSRLNEGIENWRCSYYFDSYGFTKNIKVGDVLFSSGSVKTKKNRIVDYIVNGNNDINCSELGFGTHQNSQDLIETGITASLRHAKNIREQKNIYKENITFLNLIIEWCCKRNIKVFLFTPPAYESYRKNLNKEQFNLMLKTCKKISSKYKNCTYHNFISDTDFIEQDFYDADHLNEKGAEKLTKKLNGCMLNQY